MSLIVGAFIGFGVVIVIVQIMPSPEAKEFAKEMGLDYHRGVLGKGSMDGDYRDHQVRISYRAGGEDSNPQTYFEVNCQNSAKIDMDISEKWVGSKLMEKLGRKNMEIGVPEFDKHFTTRGHPETYVKFILDDTIQQKIRYLRHFSYLRLHQNQIKIKVEGNVTSKRSLKRFLDMMVDIAEKVEGKEPSKDIAREFDEKLDTTHPDSQNLEKTKFCPECGTENQEEASFCKECRQEL